MSLPKALALGAISGVRSLSGPVFVSRAAGRGDLNLAGTPLAFLGSRLLSRALVVMELGELVVDKLPIAPSRTALPPLLGRAASGGLVGAAVFLSDGRRATTGAALGSTAAMAGAYAGEQLRALVAQKSGLSGTGVALAEDVAVLLIGLSASKKVR